MIFSESLLFFSSLQSTVHYNVSQSGTTILATTNILLQRSSRLDVCRGTMRFDVILFQEILPFVDEKWDLLTFSQKKNKPTLHASIYKALVTQSTGLWPSQAPLFCSSRVVTICSCLPTSVGKWWLLCVNNAWTRSGQCTRRSSKSSILMQCELSHQVHRPTRIHQLNQWIVFLFEIISRATACFTVPHRAIVSTR